MAPEHYVIVGNGAAANRAADVLRAGDPEGRITLVSDEFSLFYYRHRLRDFLVGDAPEDALVVRPASHYRDKGIRLRLGQTVVKADLSARVLFLKHMEKLHYTRLILCTGSKPRLPEVHYGYQKHFAVMKTLADARALRERMTGVKDVLIAGGDLVSVRLAAALLKKGRSVTFMVDRDSFWPLELTKERRDELAQGLTRKGARVLADDVMVGVAEAQGGGYEVTTRAGAKIRCDLVGAFFGLVPDVGFLLGSGLDLERGILVNETLQTNYPDVWAAGDCAQVYNPDIRNYWVSIGWGNAERLGEVAARNVLGQTVQAGRPAESALRFGGITVNTSWWKDF